MMKTLIAILVLSSVGFSASAKDLLVKSVSCTSGVLNPSGTLTVGSSYSEDELKKIPVGQGSLVEAGNDAVLAVKVAGTNGDGGACYNNGQPTVLVVTFSK